MSQASSSSFQGDQNCTVSSYFYQKCPECFSAFGYLKKPNSATSKLPLILTCKHTVCEDCIYKKSLNTGCIVCPICQKNNIVPPKFKDNLCEFFTPHYALVGILLLHQNPPTRRAKLTFEPTGISLRNKHLIDLDNLEGAVSLQFESKSDSEPVMDLDTSLGRLEFDTCCLHGQFTNLYCEKCEVQTCHYCFVDNHNSHGVKCLFKLPTEQQELFHIRKSYTVKVLKQLHLSKQKIDEIKNYDIAKLKQDIGNCFCNIYAKLHFAEQSLYSKLTTLKCEASGLDTIKKNISKSINELTRVLQACQRLDSRSINVYALLEKLEEIDKIPCRLVSKDGNMNPVKLYFNNIFNNLEKNFSLEVNDCDYSLVHKVDEDIEVLDDTVSSKSSPTDTSNTLQTPGSSVKNLTTIGTESADTPGVKEEYKQKITGENIKVIMTHINDVESFFILPSSRNNELQNLENAVERDISQKTDAPKLRVGHIYATLHEEKNQHATWRRGRLLGTDIKSSRDILYHIYFIDHGNYTYVPKENLRLLKKTLVEKAPFVTEYRLNNPGNIQWGPKAHIDLVHFIVHKQLFMKETGLKVDKKPVVDLMVLNSNREYESVAEHLNKKYATVSPRAKEAPPSPGVRNLKLFGNSQHFSKGQVENVFVTHIENPDQIYIQLADNAPVIAQMRTQLANFYEEHKELSCVPIIDTDIVVRHKHQHHGKWHRGTVKAVHNGKTADVFLVDIGCTVTVEWYCCRILVELFAKIECQAILVKLAHVAPADKSLTWPVATTQFLQGLIDGQLTYKMTVNKISPLEVALFQVGPSQELCINALLVDQQHASSIGPLSTVVNWFSEEETSEGEKQEGYHFQLIKQSEQIIAEEDDIEDDEMKNYKLKKIKIVKCDNPHLIHFKFNDLKEKEDKYYRELQEFYASEDRKTKKVWKVNEIVVVYDEDDQYFKRGIIKKKVDGKFSVHLYDEARSKIFSSVNFYIFDEYFEELQFVYKCCLANIKPAGDSGKWAKLAIEMLKSILTDYKNVYIKKSGGFDEDNKIIPVEMWYTVKTQGEALVPSKVNYISINQSLLLAGVAFSCGKMNDQPPLNDDILFKDDDKDSTSNSEAESDGRQVSPDFSIKNDSNGDDQQSKSNESFSWADDVEESEHMDWLQPIRLETVEFDADILCVRETGEIVLRTDEMAGYYQQMEDDMQRHFSVKPPKQKLIDWQERQKCTIKYEDKYYRGTVLSRTSNKEVSCIMIDWGSDHIVDQKHLFDEYMFDDVPPLINKVKLYDVEDKSGMWSLKDSADIKDNIPEKARVKVMSSLELEVPEVEIYYETGESFNDYIVEICPDLMRVRKKLKQGSPVPEARVEAKTVSLFVQEPFPGVDEDGNLPKIRVVNVLQYNEIVIDVLNEARSLKELSFYEEMQNSAGSQEVLATADLNAPCICNISESGWCRGWIYNTESLEFGYVTVFVVDLGVLYPCPVEEVREIKTEWFDTPIYNYIAKLSIEINKDPLKKVVKTQMSNLLIGKSKLLNVVTKEPLVVNLFDSKDVLSYQNLIDSGVIRKI